MACVVTEHIAWTKLFPVPPVVTTISTKNPTYRNKFLKLLFSGLFLLICSINRILKGRTPFYFQSIVHSFPAICYYTGCFMICGRHCKRLVFRYLRSKKFPSTWVLFSIVILWMFFNSHKSPLAKAASHLLKSVMIYTISNNLWVCQWKAGNLSTSQVYL
jgi:hypothetical protein